MYLTVQNGDPYTCKIKFWRVPTKKSWIYQYILC